jgi:hypothetical protein
MGKTGELFLQVTAEQANMDNQYYQWLSDAEWQAELLKKEEEMHQRFGYDATFLVMWAEFLIKNGIK